MKKSIKSLIVCLLAMFVMSGCTIEFDPPRRPIITTAYDSSYDYVYYCEEPYPFEPEWCDYYIDGSVYCVWYIDGWYEEWYRYDYDSCWEYNGSW